MLSEKNSKYVQIIHTLARDSSNHHPNVQRPSKPLPHSSIIGDQGTVQVLSLP
jgi:hypothetical protein